MFIKTHIYKNTFRDSVYLMRLSSLVRGLAGVDGAEIIVGTDHNKKFLQAGGLWTEEIAAADANDLIIAVRAADQVVAEAGVKRVLEELNRAADRGSQTGEYVPRTFETAIKQLPGANLALISLPGRYVKREADKILDAGLHLMIFSDNVSLEDEVALKKKAVEKGLLVMGPDCGTAIISGVPLAFANEVQRGGIGIVAASGTGLQEVSTQIHNLGEGVSHGIGTGGRDIKAAMGGMMMLQGIKALQADPETKVIVLVSKPPEPVVAERLLAAAKDCGKPVVACFMGGDPARISAAGCIPAATLKEAAQIAVAVLRDKNIGPAGNVPVAAEEEIEAAKRKLKSGQRYLRALYSGGTLAYETIVILREALGVIHSNLAMEGGAVLADVYRSQGHTVIDFGEDEFTQGRLHPMIDPALRNQRLVAEADDPGTAVILFDLVLGYGAHPDPAGETARAVLLAREKAAAKGREIVFVASVCGTDDDFQDRSGQVAKLTGAGVTVLASNADAAMFARELLRREGEMGKIAELLRQGPKVINLGLEDFALNLKKKGEAVIHVRWSPPAFGNEGLLSLLHKLN
jgi:succinyl-CoA synthetase alpha subunit